MIYEFPTIDEPIRQGDIFVGLPRVDVSLEHVLVVENDATYEQSWADIAQANAQIQAIFPVRPVSAIVLTQDCDAIRAADISLCEIRPFGEVDGATKNAVNAKNSPKAWANMITQQARKNLKWFYLPPDARLTFSEKMAADFQVTIRVPGPDLRMMRVLRKGRLNTEADEHFRERLSEFFRRYPYDEWYPLNRAEFDEYRKEFTDVEPRTWQSDSSTSE